MNKLPMPFNNPSTYAGHSGVDYGQPTGQAILASGPGTITYVGWLNNNAGWSTIVDYDNGPSVLYCHQPKFPNFKVGSRAGYSTKIGEVGSTGRSTGPHLHMEIMNGKGEHTFAGVWIYFDRNSVVGYSTPASDQTADFIPTQEDEDMANAEQIHYKKNNVITRALLVPGTAYFMPWTENGGTYANRISTNMGTGPSTEVTESLFNAFKRAAERCANKDALTITVANAEE